MKFTKIAKIHYGDGWNQDCDSLSHFRDIMQELDAMLYEIETSIRGSGTECSTYSELARFLKQYAKELLIVAQEVMKDKKNTYEIEDEDDNW